MLIIITINELKKVGHLSKNNSITNLNIYRHIGLIQRLVVYLRRTPEL